MKLSFFIPFSHLLFFFFFFFFSGIVSGQHDLIHDTCKASAKGDPNIEYGFCTTSLQAAPASGCASLKGLGMMSIRLTRYNLTDTRCRIKHLLQKLIDRNESYDAVYKDALEDCMELYSDAIPSIKQAMKRYNSMLYMDANILISSVMDAATTCEDGFKDKKGVASPLTERNNHTFQLSAMSLSIMNILQKKPH